MHEPKYSRKSVIIFVLFILAFFAWAFFGDPNSPVFPQVNGREKEINDKARPYLKQSCLEEEKKEEVDLLCEEIGLPGELRGVENDPPFWTEFEGGEQTGTFAWTVTGETGDVNSNFVLMIEVRMSKSGKFLHYNPHYLSWGKELHVRPKDYKSSSTPPDDSDPRLKNYNE